MAERPTLHITNWSSRRLHGNGRKLTIMAAPRQWEHGDGRVPACTPLLGRLQALRAGTLSMPDYRDAMVYRLAQHDIRPGGLVAIAAGDHVPVVDGDTLLCACSREQAAAGCCHRVWVAHALAAAGWRVVLDGVEVVP